MRENAGSQKHKTLQHRFLIFTLLISLLLIVLTLGFSFAYFLRSMSATTEEYLTSYIRYADDALTERLNNATLLAHTAASDERIIQQAIRNSAPEASYPWFLEQMSVRSYLNGLIVDKSYISRIALVLHNRTIFSSGDTLYWHSIHESWLSEGKETLRTIYLSDQNRVVISRPLLVRGQVEGAVLLLLDETELCSAFAILPMEDAAIFVFSPDLQLMYASRHDLAPAEQTVLIEQPGGFSRFRNGLVYVMRYANQATGISTVSMIPVESFFRDAIHWLQFILVLVVLAVALAVGASRVFGHALFRNLNILMDGMRAVRHGDLSRRVEVSSQDEISDAADSFNRTMAHIERLTEDIRSREEQKHLAELQVLETQIRPHFVYNSISAMQYAAQMKGEEEISAAAQALGTLMRSVLGNHDAFVTLWEERTYIESYAVLQRFKLKNHFRLEWDVEEDLWSMTLPKLLLQPLVENALLHGIREQENGAVTVAAHRQTDQRILLCVTDNGLGMTQGKIAQLMEGEALSPGMFRNIGLRNVMERVRLYYQQEGGFHIVSLPGQFTSIEITIPFGKEAAE